MSGESSHLKNHNLNRELSNNEVSSTSNDFPSTVVASASIIEPTSIDASTSGAKIDSENGSKKKDASNEESLLVERFPKNSPRYVCEDESIWLDLHPKAPSYAGSEYSCSDDDEVNVVPNHRTVKRIRLSSTESIKDCQICDDFKFNEETLDYHVAYNHMPQIHLTRLENVPYPVFICKQCTTLFKTRRLLDKHLIYFRKFSINCH